ncbi:MAG TPA: Gfo/Idh/MocA family oxidoreductase [Thermomicrobiales bacterium]|nr:Gfo/Idh/MocA family oxidoreductase [Thermomicrobiales bacterium]
MLRLGIVDGDTSHVYQFSRRINHVDIEAEQWVDGARVVAAWVGPSRVTSPERVREYVSAMQAAGVELVDRPEDLIGQIDAVLIESNEGGVHRERALPFIEAGLPTFIDKPLASSVEDAVALVEAADRTGIPLLSASALRFAADVVNARDDASIGRILGAHVYSPAHLHEANPGLFHYGVHGVEMLYALLGAGCREVSCIFSDDAEVVTGRWDDGRLGELRGIRTGADGFGLTAFGDTGISTVAVDTTFMYRDLLRQVIAVLSGNAPSIPARELVEVVAFQVAALESIRRRGELVPISW